jgi:hypothetical protein
MIEMSVHRVRPDHEHELREWFAQLHGPRRAEAELTLREEGIDHETAVLVDGRDGLLLVYAMQSEDFARAKAVANSSTLEVDVDHRRVLRACLLPYDRSDADVVLDLRQG